MEITSELEKIFESNTEEIKEIELTYQNGGKVTGTVKSVGFNPLTLVVQKSELRNREKPIHRVNFNHVTSLEITFTDNSKRNLQ